MKISDKADTENCLFINKYTTNKLPSIFTNWFLFSSISNNCETSFASEINLQIPSVQRTLYGKDTFVYRVVKAWNDIQEEMKGLMLNKFSFVRLKSLLNEFYLNMYEKS